MHSSKQNRHHSALRRWGDDWSAKRPAHGFEGCRIGSASVTRASRPIGMVLVFNASELLSVNHCGLGGVPLTKKFAPRLLIWRILSLHSRQILGSTETPAWKTRAARAICLMFSFSAAHILGSWESRAISRTRCATRDGEMRCS